MQVVRELQLDYSDFNKSLSYRYQALPSFLGGAADISLLYSFVRTFLSTSSSISVLETGVAAGYSSLAILQAFIDSGSSDSSLISVDAPYRRISSHYAPGSVVPNSLEYRKNWTLKISSDKYFLSSLSKQSRKFNLIHYDSDKTFEGRMISYPLCYEILSSNGVLISDDIGDNNAFIQFCTDYNLTPLVYYLDNKYIGIIRK